MAMGSADMILESKMPSLAASQAYSPSRTSTRVTTSHLVPSAFSCIRVCINGATIIQDSSRGQMVQLKQNGAGAARGRARLTFLRLVNRFRTGARPSNFAETHLTSVLLVESVDHLLSDFSMLAALSHLYFCSQTKQTTENVMVVLSTSQKSAKERSHLSFNFELQIRFAFYW